MAVATTAAVALALRWPRLHRPISFDEADYAVAAVRYAVSEHWWRLGEVSALRHQHPPLLAYVLQLATAIGGVSEPVLRLPGMLASTTAAALVVVATMDLAGGRRHVALGAGLFGGLMIATSPASVHMGALARPQPLVELLIVLNLWSIARWLRAPSRATAVPAGVALGLQFVAMEYGAVLLGALVLTAFGGPRMDRASRARVWRGVRDIVVVAVLTVLALWPAGIVKLGVPENLEYYVAYSQRGHPVEFDGRTTRHVPWWAYLHWYRHEQPAALLLLATALAATLVRAAVDRTPVARWLAVATVAIVAAIHCAHIIALPYSAFAVPALALSGAVAAAELWGRVASPPVALQAVLGALGFATAGLAAVASWAAGPGIDAPIKRVTRTFCAQAAPGDAILAHAWPVVRYVVLFECGRQDLVVRPYDPSNAADVRRIDGELAARRFAWALVAPRPRRRFPDSAPLRTIEGTWTVVARDGGHDLYRRPRWD
jgi:4-amino-4-deoxy-L-arabinose transferase-like glycosyltransferase